MPSSSAAAWVQSATVPAVIRKLPDIPWAATAQCSLVFGPPFSAANGLIAAHRARAVLMRFDESSIHHKDVRFQVCGRAGEPAIAEHAILTPAAATQVRILQEGRGH